MADFAEYRCRQTVGGITLIGVEFQHHAAVELGGVVGVCQFRMIGMDGVGVVRRYHERSCQHPVVIIAHATADTLQRTAEQIAVGTLRRVGAHFFSVKYHQHLNVPGGISIQEALGAAIDAVQIIQCGGGDKFILQAPDSGFFPKIQVKVLTQDGTAGGFFQKRLQLSGGIGPAHQGNGIHSQIPALALVDIALHVDGHIGD